jgi:hypothetical protein
MPTAGGKLAPEALPPMPDREFDRRTPLRFFAKLKRRNLFRIGMLYLGACWLILNPAHVVFDILAFPAWVNRLLLASMAIGFPAVLLVAWMFEITPQGIKPTALVDARWSMRRRNGQRLDLAIAAALVLALGYFVMVRFWPPGPAAVVVHAGGAPVHLASTEPAVDGRSIVAPNLAAVLDNAGGGDAVVTILNGQVLFIRGANRFRAAPGVRLEDGDIIATGANTFLQLEFDGATRIELGPMSQLMLLARETGAAPRRGAYLLTGWFKVTAEAKSAPGLNVVRSERLELIATENVTVTKAVAGEVGVFAKVGDATLIDREFEASPRELVLLSGQCYARGAQGEGAVSARPGPDLLATLPADLRDTLPSRIDWFRNRVIAAEPAAEFAYSDVQPWLKCADPLCQQLIERGKGKVRVPEFRKALEANLSDLPGWSRVLHPTKVRPGMPALAPTARPTAKSPPS